MTPAATPAVDDEASDRNVVDTVRRAAARHLAGHLSATLDERYRVAVVMIERLSAAGPQTICVELLDNGPAAGAARWTAIAYDELDETQTDPSRGESLSDALNQLVWTPLNREAHDPHQPRTDPPSEQVNPDA